MNTTQSSNNGTRLSLDIRDLPQTPFGMKSPRLSSKSKKLNQGASAGKLSRRTQRKLIESSGEEENVGSFESNKGYWGNPRNALPSWLKPISFQDSTLKKERHVFVKIPEVEEDCESDDGDAVDIITAGEVDVDPHNKVAHNTSHGTYVPPHMKFTEASKQNNKDYANPGSSNSGSGNSRIAGAHFDFRERNKKDRNSLLTDIDEDGSFIEFCHVNPKVQPVVQKHLAKNQLYYTCDSHNESQFSTSTKLPLAPVGLRKYIDAVEKVDYLGIISDGRNDAIPRSPVVKKGPVMYPTEDSILIGGPRFQPPGEPVLHQAINSTFAEFSNRKNQPISRMSLQDVSSITTGYEVVLSSDSSSSSPATSPAYIKRVRAPKATNTVIVLDSSDDEMGHKSTDEFQPKDTVTIRRRRFSNRKVRNSTFSDESLSLVLQLENITVQENSPKKSVQNCQGKLEENSRNISSPLAPIPTEEATTVLLSDPETTIHLSVSQQVLKNPTSYLWRKETTPNEKSLHEFIKTTGVKNTTISPTISSGEISPVAQWVMTSPFRTVQLSSPESALHSDSRDTVLLNQDSSITNDQEQGVREKNSEVNKTDITPSRIAENKTTELPGTRKSPYLNLYKDLSLQMSEKNGLRTDSNSESERLPVNNGTRITRTPLDKEENANPNDTCTLMDRCRKGQPASTNDTKETTFFSPKVDGQEYISVCQASTINLTQLEEELDKIYNTEWRKNKSSILEGTRISATGKVQRKYVLSSSEEEEGGFAESSEKLCNSQALRLHLTGKTESHPLMTDDESDEVEKENFFSTCSTRNKSEKPRKIVIESSDDETRCDEIEEDSLYIKRTNSDEAREIVVESSDDETECHEVEDEDLYLKRTKPDKLRKTVVESSDDDLNSCEIEENSLHIKITKSEKTKKIVIGPSDETKCCKSEEESLFITRNKAEKQRKIVIESSSDEARYSESEEDSRIMTKTKPVKSRSIVVKSSDDEIETTYWSEIRAHLSRPERKAKKVVISESGSDSEEDDVFKGNESTKSSIKYSVSDDSSYYLPSLSKRLNVQQPRFRCTELGSISGELKNSGKPKMLTPLPRSFTERQPPRETVLLTSDSDEEYCSPKLAKPKTQVFAEPKPKVITEVNLIHTPITKPTKPSAVTEPRPQPNLKNKFTYVHTDNLAQHTPTLTFLSSLTAYVDPHRCHPEARPYLKNFKRCKEDLAQHLYSYYNTHVFENKLPATMNIKWNARLRKTAGFCYYQIDRSKQSGRAARLELSSKVIDAPERLRDTLIHEMCHAAAWIINGYKDGHGPLWKAWSAKAMSCFPELPSISRCHSYEIACKYTYKCTQCGYSIGRHSKSLDTEQKVCGHCRGKFQLIVNAKPTPVSGHSKTPNSANPPPLHPTPKTPRTPSAFALFVKANYGSLRKVKSSHAEVMKALSAEFNKLKTNHT